MEDLYPEYNTDSPNHAGYAPAGFAEMMMSRMDRIDEELRRVRKSKKHGKKKSGKSKKLKRRLKAMEAEHEQLKYFLQGFVMQQTLVQQNGVQQYASSKPWWQNAVTTVLPNVVDALGGVANNMTKKRPQILNSDKHRPLYLPDGLDQ